MDRMCGNGETRPTKLPTPPPPSDERGLGLGPRRRSHGLRARLARARLTRARGLDEVLEAHDAVARAQRAHGDARAAALRLAPPPPAALPEAPSSLPGPPPSLSAGAIIDSPAVAPRRAACIAALHF